MLLSKKGNSFIHTPPPTVESAPSVNCKNNVTACLTQNLSVSTRVKSGFTLIELLVVVLIIGILAAIAVPQYQKAVDKTKFVQAVIMHQKIYEAQQVFRLASGSYAVTWGELADLDLPTPTQGGGDTDTYVWWNGWYCMLASPSGVSPYGMCAVNYPGGRAAVQSYWHSSSKSCYASQASPRAQQVCKSVTGTATRVINGADYIYSF